ncbi:hypothetical protein P171DRAFT_445949 [Karstenula rhodostoma CBS 690.94]|uniref:Uncharacterized protein n=1 Tax=Karstenula rhodostoma CBS 690.94 TaxID=1392251 RepID=A0A9P4PBZ8_9PLEO|nr:hypothetical protein P171DRAFT_445949 [Karstenula rhodostoma CBS 690.94]
MLLGGCRVRVRIGIVTAQSSFLFRALSAVLHDCKGSMQEREVEKFSSAYASPHPSVLTRRPLAVPLSCAFQGICPTNTDISSFEVGGLAFTYRLELGGPTELAGHAYHARSLTAAGNHMGITDPHASEFLFSRDSPKNPHRTIPGAQSFEPTPL